MEQENTPTNDSPQQPKKSGWRNWAIAGAVATALIGGAGVASALSDDFGGFGGHMRHGMQGGGDQMRDGGEGHMRDGGDGQMGGPMHANFGGHGPRHGGFGPGGIERMIDGIDATDEQEKQLWDIADSVRDEVRPLMREMRDTREKLTELLGAPTVDTGAVEALRAERVAKLDEVSKKVTAALVQAANVLTPEQRAKLAQEIEDRGPGGRW